MNKKIDTVSEGVDTLNQRVVQLEQEPVEKWKKIGFEIVKYVVLAVVGAVVGYFIRT